MGSGVTCMSQRDGSRRRRRRALARRYALSGGKAAAIACACVVALLAGVYVVRTCATSGVVIERGESDAASGEAQGAVDDAGSGEEVTSDSLAEEAPSIVVHVDGAVASPGVYTLTGSDLRINDAVSAAGGLTAEADTSSVNLAAAVSDGEKVHVPTKEEASTVQTLGSADASSGSATVSSSGTGSQTTQLVNINSADSAALQTLPGVGEATAAAIIRDREANGPFSSIEDIMRISGIGEKKFAKIKDYICV